MNFDNFLLKFTTINGYFTIPIINVIGFVFNLTTLTVLINPYKIKEKKEFRFIIFKVILDIIASLTGIAFSNALCFVDCIEKHSYVIQLFKLVFHRYGSYSHFVLTGIVEIFLTYDRYLMIKNRKIV